MKESACTRSPSLQNLHDLVEQLALMLTAVESPELAQHLVENIARLEMLAACDETGDEARLAYQVGHALVTTCERLLGIATLRAEQHPAT